MTRYRVLRKGQTTVEEAAGGSMIVPR